MCRGFINYAAPLCYLYAEPSDCGRMLLALYRRFWCRLHSIDGTGGQHATLISLCALFQHLLMVSSGFLFRDSD